MIKKIQIALSKEIEFVRINENIKLEDKMDEVDVLLDTIKFLKNYDRNIEILKKYTNERGMEK